MTELARAAIGSSQYGTWYLVLSYELVSQSIANNTSRVKLQISLICPVYIQVSSGNLKLTSSTGDIGTVKLGNYYAAGTHVLWNNGDGWDLGHNDDGTLNNYKITGTISTTYLLSGTVSAIIPIPAIPRRATVSNRIDSTTETTIKVNWNASATVDYVWYSLDNGPWVEVGSTNATSGNYTISGVKANTEHTVKTQVRRKDSQLTSDTVDAIKAKTYDYPYCTSAPNFTVGNSLTLKFYNPLKRSITITGISKADGSTIFNGTTNSDTASGFNDSGSIGKQYKSIPNKTSSTYKVRVVYGTSTRDFQGGTYSINQSVNTPACGNFTYKDTNDVTTKLTGNNQVLVDGYSKCEITTEEATAKNHASISSYDLYWGKTINVKTGNTIVGAVDKGSGSILKVTAIDSRGLSSYKSKDITNLKYVNPFISSVATERKNGVDVETNLSTTFKLWDGNWNSTSKNQLMYFAYRVKTDNTWSGYFDITAKVKSLARITKQNNIQTYAIDFSDKLAIHANGSSGGFEVGKQYTIEIMIRDGNGTVTNTLVSAGASTTVTDGKIGLSRYKDSNGDYHYGIGKMPNDEFALDVAGKLAINGNEVLRYKVVDTW